MSRIKNFLGLSSLLLLPVFGACDDPFMPDPVRTYVDVTTGGNHSCAVDDQGDAYCWGQGVDGQLGNGTYANQNRPVLVSAGLELTQITAGYAHTCALGTDGRAYCWGFNAYHQTGVLLGGGINVPYPVETTERFTQLSAGAYHTCGVTLSNEVFCWGYNRHGQLGTGTTESAPVPERVLGLQHAIKVSAGSFHTCALTGLSQVWCWGSNDSGQLGIGSESLAALEPAQVQTGLGFIDVDAGSLHTCAIASDRSAACWGSAEFGQLGDGAPYKPGVPGPSTPTTAIFLQEVQEISAGFDNTCAVAVGHTLCWGWGAYGQNGVGNNNDYSVRQPVFITPQQPLPFEIIAPGGYTHTCGLTRGTIYCWGTGYFGQLGGGASLTSFLPQRVRS